MGPVLSFNRKRPMEDARVSRLRERLGVPGEAADLRYDAALAEAVKEFQRANDLPATGNLDARTIKKLNPTNDRRIDAVIANMERWRWYPRELRNSRVEVNEPDFTLKVLHEGGSCGRLASSSASRACRARSWRNRWISSPSTRPGRCRHSIVQNEYLPAQRRGPGTLARMGLRVKRVDGEVQITMPPGGENPLGRIRFNFFNRFTVFQHDTPDQYLFAHVVRAESHGCMRVQDAAKYAEVLAGIVQPEEQWTADKIRSLYRRRRARDFAWVGADLDLPDLSDRLCGRRRQAADAPRPLQSRQPHAGCDQEHARDRQGGTRAEVRAGEMAAPEPAAPAQRRKVAPRTVQQTAAHSSIFFTGAPRSVRQQPVRSFIAGHN